MMDMTMCDVRDPYGSQVKLTKCNYLGCGWLNLEAIKFINEEIRWSVW